MDSTVSKDSRDITFAKFDQVFYFLWILQVAAEIWNLNFYLNFDLIGGLTKADWTGYVASSYRLVPIR
jgi:hypothetical protein